MPNEAEILKYLDKELSEKEKENFEEQLRRKPELKQQLEAVNAKRREVLYAIESFNPTELVEIPEFKTMQKAGSKKLLFSLRRWKIAAAILILAAASIAFFFLPDKKTQNTMTAENNAFQKAEEDALCSELDYYISPNRCWNKRELVWTIVELENGN